MSGAAKTTAETLAAIPRVDAVHLSRGRRGGHRAAGRRRAVAAVVLTPVLYVVYLAFSGLPSAPGFGWTVTLAAMALLGAATLASYVPEGPRRGTADGEGRATRVATPPCAASGALSVPLAALIVSGATQSAWSGGFALAILALAAVQRMWAPASCSAP